MNKTMLAMALAVVAGATSLHAAAFDGRINFEGEIVSNTCHVTTGTANQTIQLPKINPGMLTADQATASRSRFVIRVETCPVASARAYFEADAQAIDYVSNSLRNVGGTATNVGFALFEETNDARIVLGAPAGTQNTAWRPITADTVDLGYEAAYVRVGGPVTAGTVRGSVTYSVEYP
jgi:major type 1 subunit fimbrin (pilin)